MTAHTHRTIVPGCYRCELNEDEMRPEFDVSPTTPPTIASVLAAHWRRHNNNAHRGILGGWNVDCICGWHGVDWGERGAEDVFLIHQADELRKVFTILRPAIPEDDEPADQADELRKAGVVSDASGATADPHGLDHPQATSADAMNEPPLSLPHGSFRHLADVGIRVLNVETFGPAGLKLTLTRGHDAVHGSLIVTQADYAGAEWLHASIAWVDRVPSYAELTVLHRVVFGRRRWAYQVFAPASDHVNIHEHALHLFGRVDGAPALPDFTRGSGSI